MTDKQLEIFSSRNFPTNGLQGVYRGTMTINTKNFGARNVHLVGNQGIWETKVLRTALENVTEGTDINVNLNGTSQNSQGLTIPNYEVNVADVPK